ncbi:MAG: glycosyltransferase [Henriciella sp.]
MHYLKIGEPAGLSPHPLFDPDWYLQSYPDIREDGMSAIVHFMQYGAKEGRKPHPLFSPATFNASLPRQAPPKREALNPIVRYTRFGLEEKTVPHTLFDAEHYLKQYPEIAAAKTNPLIHYLDVGFADLMSPSPHFDEEWYRAEYENHLSANQSGLVHHVRHGARNGFATNPVSHRQAERQTIDSADAPNIVNYQKRANTLNRRAERFGFITTNNGSYIGGSEVLWKESAHRLLEQGYEVVILIKKWDPAPEFLNVLFEAGAQIIFKEDGGFETFLSLRPSMTVISIGDQDEGIEYYGGLQSVALDYVIVNQLTKERRFWPVREKRNKRVRSGYLGAERVYFTCKNNQVVMEDRLGLQLPNAEVHFNPYHIDRAAIPAWPINKSGPHIAVPSKLLFLHKGQDLLLDAASKDRFKELSHWTFNFYGEGPDPGALTQRIKELGISNFKLHGRISKIADIWTENHALLMPSRMEGLPIMVVSALLSERMCITTDVGGHSEVIQDKKTGFIIPNPEPNSILKTLLEANDRLQDWKAMGEAGREFMLSYLPKDPVEDFISRIKEISTAKSELRTHKSSFFGLRKRFFG